MSIATTQGSGKQGSGAPETAIPYDPTEGSSHPPAPARKPASKAQEDLRPALRWMRSEMVREFVRRLRRKSHSLTTSSDSEGPSLSKRMKKRKAALVMSGAVMAVSPGMVEYGRTAPAYTIGLERPNPSETRLHAKELKASEAFKEALAEEEGVRLTVYRDVAGYPTVGVGHLIRPADGLKVGDRITYEEALEFLEQDLKTAERGVQRLVGDLSLYQHEFDALVDLVYNVGEGNVSDRASPRLNRAIASNDYDGIADELSYHHAAGAVANGLVYRSERRQAIFKLAAYDDPRPAHISVAGNITT